MYEGEKGDILILRSRDTTLMTKHVTEVNNMLKDIPVRNLSEFKHIARASEKVGIKIDHTINKKETFWMQRLEKGIAILRKDSSRIDD